MHQQANAPPSTPSPSRQTTQQSIPGTSITTQPPLSLSSIPETPPLSSPLSPFQDQNLGKLDNIEWGSRLPSSIDFLEGGYASSPLKTSQQQAVEVQASDLLGSGITLLPPASPAPLRMPITVSSPAAASTMLVGMAETLEDALDGNTTEADDTIELSSGTRTLSSSRTAGTASHTPGIKGTDAEPTQPR
eukprot:1241535-Pleurochrysis_carterae.AAC.3